MIALLRKSFFVFSLGVLSFPVLVSAQFDPSAGGQTQLPESTIWEIIQNAMLWLLYVVAFFAVIAFVISGILYLTSAGNEDRASSAKNAMIYAILGVIVALLGLIILAAANSWLGGSKIF